MEVQVLQQEQAKRLRSIYAARGWVNKEVFLKLIAVVMHRRPAGPATKSVGHVREGGGTGRAAETG